MVGHEQLVAWQTTPQQTTILGTQRNVGGVAVDTAGVLKNVDPKERKELARMLAHYYERMPQEFAGKTSLRMISLAKLEAVVADCVAKKLPLPNEVLHLAGLAANQLYLR